MPIIERWSYEYRDYRRPDLLTLRWDGRRWRAPIPPKVAILFDYLWLTANTETGSVTTTLRELAEIFRVSRETVRRRLRRLESARLISVYRRPRGLAVYLRWRPLGMEVLDFWIPSEEEEFSTTREAEFSTANGVSAHAN